MFLPNKWKELNSGAKLEKYNLVEAVNIEYFGRKIIFWKIILTKEKHTLFKPLRKSISIMSFLDHMNDATNQSCFWFQEIQARFWRLVWWAQKRIGVTRARNMLTRSSSSSLSQFAVLDGLHSFTHHSKRKYFNVY